MNTAAGPSALARSPSRTVTSNTALLASVRTDFSTTTASATLEPSLAKAETVALGASLAKLPVDHNATRSGVLRWPAPRTGRLANRMADEATPFSTSVLPDNVAPLALRTISASDRFLAEGVPIVFWAGAVMALVGAAAALPFEFGVFGPGIGVWANVQAGISKAGSNRPAIRPAARVALMGTCIGRTEDKREWTSDRGRTLTKSRREPIFRPLLPVFNPEAG